MMAVYLSKYFFANERRETLSKVGDRSFSEAMTNLVGMGYASPPASPASSRLMNQCVFEKRHNVTGYACINRR
jgi:hypothetical protein